jgi:AcrR family transcriptional regulator
MNQVQSPSHRRATPVQARSAATVETILAASSALLVEQGLPGFNTNAVARAAGVNVATLYHYYPHKNAILRELFERDEQARAAFVRTRFVDLASAGNLADWVHDMVSTLLHMRQAQPAGVALRRACRAVPELMEAEEAVNSDLGTRLGASLQRRLPGLADARAMVAGRTMVEVTSTMLDFAGDRPETADDAAAVLEGMIRGLFVELEKMASAAGE